MQQVEETVPSFRAKRFGQPGSIGGKRCDAPLRRGQLPVQPLAQPLDGELRHMQSQMSPCRPRPPVGIATNLGDALAPSRFSHQPDECVESG
jgi:hypothetical protein